MAPQLLPLHLFLQSGIKSINYHPPHPAPVLHIRNTLISEPFQVATWSVIAFTFLPTFIPLNPPPLCPLHCPTMAPLPLLNSFLSYSHTVTHMKALTAYTSICCNILSILLAIFNNIRTAGNFLPYWLEALILPFFKLNKSDNLTQKCCPIALTSCLCKLLKTGKPMPNVIPRIFFSIWIPSWLKHSWSTYMYWKLHHICLCTPGKGVWYCMALPHSLATIISWHTREHGCIH